MNRGLTVLTLKVYSLNTWLTLWISQRSHQVSSGSLLNDCQHDRVRTVCKSTHIVKQARCIEKRKELSPKFQLLSLDFGNRCTDETGNLRPLTIRQTNRCSCANGFRCILTSQAAHSCGALLMCEMEQTISSNLVEIMDSIEADPLHPRGWKFYSSFISNLKFSLSGEKDL